MNSHDEMYEGEVQKGDMALLSDPGMALGAVERASIDMQIATAKTYPRSIEKALKEAETLATLNEQVAGSMFYRLPARKNRDGTEGSPIEGPSVRLAEVIAYSWTNLRVMAEITERGQTHVTARGMCFDLERNIAFGVSVKRRITSSGGRRYGEDMIGVTENAAIKIALRNAVFTTIPASLVRTVYDKARIASTGKGTIEQKRRAAGEYFRKLGVQEAELFQAIGVQGWDDVGEEQLIALRGFRTSIEDGDGSVETIFRPKPEEKPKSQAGEELRQASDEDAPEGPQDGQEAPRAIPTPRDAVHPRKTTKASPPPPVVEAPAQAQDVGEEDEGKEEDEAPDSQPDDEEDLAALLDPAALDTAIEGLEGELGLKGGTLSRRRRRFLNGPELDGATRESKLEYHAHLRDCLS